jgi:hypothetical protein
VFCIDATLVANTPAAGSTGLDLVDDVPVLYPTSVVIFRKKRSTSLPSQAYERDGRASLLSVRALGPRLELSQEQVAFVRASQKKRWRFAFRQEEGRELRFVLDDGRSVRLLLPKEESRLPRQALRMIFGNRYSEGFPLEKFRSGEPLCYRVYGRVLFAFL